MSPREIVAALARQEPTREGRAHAVREECRGWRLEAARLFLEGVIGAEEFHCRIEDADAELAAQGLAPGPGIDEGAPVVRLGGPA